MSNYTKGPWIVKEQPVRHLGFYIQQDGFRESQRAFIGECGGGTQEFEEIKANAYIMAAAPDLLECCKIMIQAFKDAPKDWLMTNDVMQAESIMMEAVNKAVSEP